MKKTAKKTTAKKAEKVVEKKHRTPEQKAARKLRRAQRRANVKSMATVKENIDTPSKSPFKPLVSQWAPVATSDGLPFSKSVDNPDSLLGQLKRMEINAEKAKADEKINAAKALKEFRTPMYAGHSGLSAPNVASFD